VNICIIPARGGSKRIPKKNIRPFFGKPILAYSIEAAIKADCFDRIIVSTDDNQIKEVAIAYGADVPFIRPESISNDYASTMDVIQHCIDWCERQNIKANKVCCLYATAPFVTVSDILRGLAIIDQDGVEYAFTATSYPFPIQRSFYLDEDERINMFYPLNMDKRSQDLVEAYHDAGQFYWGKVNAFKEALPFFAAHSKPILLPRQSVQDIDTLEDWDMAEALYAAVVNKTR
jgi:pseudaminic acid cytidylyltransferase